MTTKIGITGITGRMGRLIAAEVVAMQDLCQLAGGYARPGQKAVGQDIGKYLGFAPLGVSITDQLAQLFSQSDVVIDFTQAEATRHHLQFAEKTKTPIVIGTTALTDEDHEELARLSQKVPLVYAPNMTLGVTVLAGVVHKIAKILGTDFDVEILEMHHRQKRDAPSGTSLFLGKEVAAARGVEFSEVAVVDRVSSHSPRHRGDIGFAVMRGGNVLGDHSVVFASDHEVLTVSHHIQDRAVFAKGAIKAALWLKDKPAGQYDMQDVLGLKD